MKTAWKKKRSIDESNKSSSGEGRQSFITPYNVYIYFSRLFPLLPSPTLFVHLHSNPFDILLDSRKRQSTLLVIFLHIRDYLSFFFFLSYLSLILSKTDRPTLFPLRPLSLSLNCYRLVFQSCISFRERNYDFSRYVHLRSKKIVFSLEKARFYIDDDVRTRLFFFLPFLFNTCFKEKYLR